MKKILNYKIQKAIFNYEAFTLVELLGVIIILGVIALITFPIMINQLEIVNKNH